MDVNHISFTVSGKNDMCAVFIHVRDTSLTQFKLIYLLDNENLFFPCILISAFCGKHFKNVTAECMAARIKDAFDVHFKTQRGYSFEIYKDNDEELFQKLV